MKSRLTAFILICQSLVLMLFLSINLAYAQENDAETEELNEKEVIEQSTTEPDVSENNNRNFDVFMPSEDISEDLAVPFPVDI